MSEMKEQIESLEAKLSQSFVDETLIDPKEVKLLCDLRMARLTELVSTHKDRTAVMKQKTAELMGKIPAVPEELNKLLTPLMDQIYAEQDKYDVACKRWVISETCLWEESEAASIAAGILILFNEIR